MSSNPAPSAPVPSGNFEVSSEKFFEITKDRAQDVQILELKEALPGLFVGTDRVPRLAGRVWRRACDEMIAENRGIYTPKGGTQVELFFFDLTAAVGKAKVSIIKSRLPELMKSAQGDESVLDKPLPVRAAAVQKEAPTQASQNLAKIAHGLPDNPALELVQLWAARMTQELTASTTTGIPLMREMMDVAGKADFSCLPLWNGQAQAILGSCVSVKGSVPPAQYNSGELLRQDLAALFGACFQLYSMQTKGVNALVIIPARATTLTEKNAGELYMALLRRMSPEVRKNVIIEVSDVPKHTPSPSLSAALNVIAQHVRGYIFETGILTHADFLKASPKLHACGFDSAAAFVGEHEQVRLMKKFADYYHAAGVKTFVQNASSPYVLEAALLHGYTYVSGACIRPAQKACFAVQKLMAADLKRA